MNETAGTLRNPTVVRIARRLRALCAVLEGAVEFVVAGSVAAIGSVHPWAYVPLWWACGSLGLLVVARAALARQLRQRVGPRRILLPWHGPYIVLDAAAEGPEGWSLDLRRRLIPAPPLLLPGLVFAAWVTLQVVPVPRTVSMPDTVRGLTFLIAFLSLHVAAAAVFEQAAARARFRRFVAVLGFALGLVALVQLATGTTRIYGIFEPWDGASLLFGPFVNWNHFAGYMLLVVPMCLDIFTRAYRRYRNRFGGRWTTKRVLSSLSTAEGASLLYAGIPVLVSLAALLATTSRGGLLAFVAGAALAMTGHRRQGGAPTWILAAMFLGAAVTWFGTERLETRFARAIGDAPGRTLVWKDALKRMDGFWIGGSGFNTFGIAMSRTAPWSLPVGATPWPEWLQVAAAHGSQVGVRVLADMADLVWYREAHNDYLQILVETGLPGLLVVLWGAASVLRASRRDPWLVAGLASLLMHEFVEFDLQIPAVATLFVALAALRSSSD